MKKSKHDQHNEATGANETNEMNANQTQGQTQGQGNFSEIIDQWVAEWHKKICRDPSQPHNLDQAAKELKEKLGGKDQDQDADQNKDAEGVNADSNKQNPGQIANKDKDHKISLDANKML